jgi:hypothetical protein
MEITLMFTEAQKATFAYHTDTTQLVGDPLALQRKLNVQLQGDIHDAIRSAYEKTGDTDGSMDRLLTAVREVFSLPPIDPTTGKGVTDLSALAVLHSFGEFLQAKKI